MADKRLVTFQDTIGQELAWARAAPYQCTVVWRRWHEGEGSSWVLYGLVREEETQADQQIWEAYEPDLCRWEEGPWA